VRCKPIELKDGTIVCGTSVESYGSWSSWMELIGDGGKSWTRVGPITLPGHRMAVIQPTVWEVKPGHLRTFMRSHQPIDRICQSDSMDNGQTWSEAKTTALPNNNSGVDAVKLKDGRVVLIYNHLTRKAWSGSRKEIHLNLSTDGGETWGEPFMIEGKGEEYSYPAIIEAADGMIHMTYTWNRVKVRHLTVSPDELKGLIPH
jgi:predicted neuraminidase